LRTCGPAVRIAGEVMIAVRGGVPSSIQNSPGYATASKSHWLLWKGRHGGPIAITSSSAGLKGTGTAGGQAYTAAKQALEGLM
jgi:NAD(P)-dependent dehydrogenase (short-subunit alcohol dehydrogenase family)